MGQTVAMPQTDRSSAHSISAPPTAAMLLTLKRQGPQADVFVARHNLDNLAGFAFGGQLLAQALAAAGQTASNWPATQAQGIFMRGGLLHEPITYHVERMRDGARFAHRRVLARQGGTPVFDFSCSFQKPQDGPSHQGVTLGDIPLPETLRPIADLVAEPTGPAAQWPEAMRRIFTLPFPIELRPVDQARVFARESAPSRDLWMRVGSAANLDAAADHQALVLLMSDYWLPGAAAAHAGRAGKPLTVTSLNHAIWLHAPARVDEWMLYRTGSDWLGSGRGLARGLLYDRQGALVATVMQEALLRSL